MLCAVGLYLYNVLPICEDIQNHSSVDISKKINLGKEMYCVVHIINTRGR